MKKSKFKVKKPSKMDWSVLEREAKKVCQKYLDKAGLKSSQDATVEKIELAFKLGFEDFLAGRLCLDYLSVLCGELSLLLEDFVEKGVVNLKEEGELYFILMEGSIDIRFYLRSPREHSLLTGWLGEVYMYFGVDE